MVVLGHNKSETEGLLKDTVKEANLPSHNNSTMNKRFSTWKRSARSNTCKKPVGGVVPSACNRKRFSNGSERDDMKKPRKWAKTDVIEQNTSKAEGGENQPRHTL